MPIGEEALGGYARYQIEAARRDRRLGRGHGAMIDDFGLAVEEVERTRMMNIIGLQEIRESYKHAKADFDAHGGSRQREDEVQTFWQRAELAQVEADRDHPAINAQALVALNSALDALVEHLVAAVRDLPFQMRMRQAEEQVPEAAEHLTPEIRQQLISKMQDLLNFAELESLRGKGASRYERRLSGVGLGASKDRPIPQDLDQALTEFGVIRDCLVHRGGRIDARALALAPSLSSRYGDGNLIRLNGEDYRTYSAALRCYAAEVIHRLYGKWPGLIDPEDTTDFENWRQCHLAGA